MYTDVYETGYRQLVDGILQNPHDAALIKANISEMVTNYAWILKLDHRNLFQVLGHRSWLAIMCLLMNEQTRKYYLPVEKVNEEGILVSDIELNTDKRDMYERICSIIGNSFFRKELGENLKTFAGVTDGYWKDLEPKGKKYMIINIGTGDYARSAGLSGGDLSREDILNQFVILDGIDYKSNSPTHRLVYMEV